MKAGRMQAKDVPDVPVLEFLEAIDPAGEFPTGNPFQRVWDRGEVNSTSVQHAMPEGTPYKVVLAKMGRLIDRGLVEGCNCGCRGEFLLTDKGRTYLAHYRAVANELARMEAGRKTETDILPRTVASHYAAHTTFALPVSAMTRSCVELAEYLSGVGKIGAPIEIPGLNHGRPFVIKKLTRREFSTRLQVTMEYVHYARNAQEYLAASEEGYHEFPAGPLPLPNRNASGVVIPSPGPGR